MPKAVRRHANEKFEAIMRRFKRAVEKDGVLQTYREREFYIKPSLARRRAKQAAILRHKRGNAEGDRRTRAEDLNPDE